jgi:hypothetical protein
MSNYVVLSLHNDQLYLAPNIAREIFAGENFAIVKFRYFFRVLFYRCVLLFLSIPLFVFRISVRSLMSFQREGINEFARPSERHDVDVVCEVIYNATDFQ